MRVFKEPAKQFHGQKIKDFFVLMEITERKISFSQNEVIFIFFHSLFVVRRVVL
jgi:hypothetical protein